VSPCIERRGGWVHRLPLITLYITERCNSRCVTCDYWRTGRTDMTLDSVARMLPSLEQMGTQWVMLSGGEPLLNRQWAPIAELLKSHGLKVGLLTSGLSLAKHARRAVELFDDTTVSVDGIDRESYAAIRGLDAFDIVCRGIRSIAALGARPSLRVTLQRHNYRRLLEFVALAKALGAARVSFLAVDTSNPHAFGRGADIDADPSLRPEDLGILEQLIGALEQQHADDFQSGFIAENSKKLRAILQHFSARLGRGHPPAVRCNAPEFSAVIDASGRAQPCFFIPGPAHSAPDSHLIAALNGDDMRALRGDIRSGRREECRTCVCSMWRDLSTLDRFRPTTAAAGADSA
jgi:Fe-coproporphyrin III synthase